MDQTDLSAWENRQERSAGVLTAQMAGMAQACFGAPDNPPADGQVCPPLWHWFAFPPSMPTSALGPDGHPPLGGFLPPVGPARRMWAGGALTFHAALRVGEPLSRLSIIRNVARKVGAAGPMVIVAVEHQVSGAEGRVLTERHDIVYLPIPDSYAPPRKQPPPPKPAFVERVETPPTLLFRYSALTYNAHRIHYDKPYAQQVEHYPGLVVHGPLQATFLVDAATRYAGRMPTTFSYRGVHPVFAETPLEVQGSAIVGGEMSLCTCVRTDEGAHQGMQATASWEDTDQ